MAVVLTQIAQSAIPYAFGSAVDALAGTIAEVDAKLRFVRAVKDVLTDGQRAVLFHPGTEGRVQVDLLSAALVHNGVRSPVDANDRKELEGALAHAAQAIEGDDGASLFRVIDPRARHAMASIVADRCARTEGLSPGVRIGLATYPDDATSVNDLLAVAMESAVAPDAAD